MVNQLDQYLNRWGRTVSVILLLNLALALIVPADSALACTPPPGGLPHYTVADRTNAAEIVLEGTVVALIHEDNYGMLHTAIVDAQRYFKGSGPAIVHIARFGPTSLCLSPISVGQHWIFYATGDPSTGLTAHYLSQFDAVDPATSDVIAQVIAAVGHDPVRPIGYWVYLPIILKTAGGNSLQNK